MHVTDPYHAAAILDFKRGWHASNSMQKLDDFDFASKNCSLAILDFVTGSLLDSPDTPPAQ